MNAKHTPGPNARAIAEVRLARAAPDLLAALRRCVAVMEQRCPEASPLPDARAAIARAEGRQ